MTHPHRAKETSAKTAPRTTQADERAIAAALTRDQDALRGDLEAIGRDFHKAHYNAEHSWWWTR